MQEDSWSKRWMSMAAACFLVFTTGMEPAQAVPALNIRVPVQAQFGGLSGLATGKLLQQFHLPSSPNDLFEFVLEYALKQKIGNTLPLNLNANSAFPTIENAQLPGGAFQGKPLSMSGSSLRSALAPGDYVIPVMAYCTQYSVHRAGQGTAYKLAPVEGTQAEAISTLLWRGTLAGKRPQDLQVTNWAIQSGMTYGSMPKPYQAIIDEIIPDYRDKLKGNMLDVVQTTYKDVTTDPRKFLQAYIKEKYNTTVPLMILPKIAVPAPPLEVVLAKMGPAGLMVLDARKQSNILLTAYTTKELGEQTLFQGQGEQLPPEPAGEGPWTIRVPGQAYMRFIVKSGNMHGDNLMQIRILPSTQTAAAENTPHLVLAGYQLAPAPSSPAAASSSVVATSVYGLLGVKAVGDSASGTGVPAITSSGVIGYSVGGGGAQALVPVTSESQPAHKPTATITVLVHNPVIYRDAQKRVVETGLCMYLGAKISDPDHVYQTYRWLQKVADKGSDNEVDTFIDNYLSSRPPVDQPSELWWYRPPTMSFDSSWQEAGKELGYDLLYRDEPARPFVDPTRTWQAVTELLGVDAAGHFQESAALATITWDFNKGPAGPLTPTPVQINGASWQGPPTLQGIEAKYLCDHDAILAYEIQEDIDTKSPLTDTNWPLLPDKDPPPAYKPFTNYRFLP